MTTKAQQAPYLREQRNFPSDDLQALGVEIDRSYVDISQKVNARTIGLFALQTAIVTGEKWFLAGQPNSQQTLRKTFTFNSAGNIPHGINFNSVYAFTRGFGSYTDNATPDPTVSNYYGVIFGSSVSIAGQVSFYLTPTNVVVLSGAGAPTIVSGLLVIEWLSNI